MQGRLSWLLLGAVLLACVIAGIHSCRQDPASVVVAAPSASGTTANPPAPDATSEADAAKLRAQVRRHDDALYAAVATLQRYLAALGSDDRGKADAFWVNQRPPTNSHEADLRALENLRGLRIENGTPKPLDSEAVPAALEIPVELRVSVEGKPMRRYRGWYRLRRAVADDRWEITSASVDVVRRPE